MVKVRRHLYEHSLKYLVRISGYEDENGDYNEGGEYWSDPIPCDVIPSGGRASTITFENGKSFEYSYCVQFKGCPREFKVGEHVCVDYYGSEITGVVKGCTRYMFVTKIYF